MGAPWHISPAHQAEILSLLADRPRLGKEIAIDTGLHQSLVSFGMRELCEAGLVARGYSLTPKGRRRVKTKT